MLTPSYVSAPKSVSVDPVFQRAIERRSKELERQFPQVDGWAQRALDARAAPQREPLPPIPEPRSNQLKALRIFAETGDWGENDWESLLELWHRESSWRHRAQNPRSTARGLPQAMGSLYPETMEEGWLDDPEAQIRWGLNYIRNRYGTVANALAHHDEKGWY